MKDSLNFCILSKIFMAGVLYAWLANISWAMPTGYMLHIELSPAVCKLDSFQKRTRQCLDGYSLVVLGLIPEGVNPQSCATSSVPTLTPIQKRVLMRIMPDVNAQTRLWRSIGGCISMSASQYFRTMVNLAEQLNMPSDVTTPTSIVVTKERLQQRFSELNNEMPVDALRLNCDSNLRNNSAILTHIQVCYKTNGQFKTCRIEQTATCPARFTIQGSY